MVERHTAIGTSTETYNVGVIGGVVGGSVKGTRTSRLEVVWRGRTLVIFTGQYSGPDRTANPYTEVAEEWTLDARGQLVIERTRRATGSDAEVTTVAYRRQ